MINSNSQSSQTKTAQTIPTFLAGEIVAIHPDHITLIETNPRIYCTADGACFKPFGNNNYVCIAASIHADN